MSSGPNWFVWAGIAVIVAVIVFAVTSSRK